MTTVGAVRIQNLVWLGLKPRAKRKKSTTAQASRNALRL